MTMSRTCIDVSSSHASTERRCLGVARVALVAMMAACGGGAGSGSGSGTDTTTGDSSTTSARAIGSLHPSESVSGLSARGTIASITAEEVAPGYPAARIEIAGDTPIEGRSFSIMLPPEIPSPFRVGDDIALLVETLPGPPTYQPRNVVVTGSDGRLLAMYGVTAPDGWIVDASGEASRVDHGEYDEVSLHVTFTHAGESAVTEASRWRRMTTSDGVWYVAGQATELEGEIPPDGGGTMSFMIVRGGATQPR